MSSSSSQLRDLSRRTINDLPAELKKRIVELVALQDESYKQWTTAIHPHLEDGLQPALEQQRQRYGKSLGALFQCSKAWSDLAAPFRFKVLKASRADILFQLNVPASRHQHFTRIELDSPDPACLTATLVVGSKLLRLRELVLLGPAVLVATTFPFYLRRWPVPDTLHKLFSFFLYETSATVTRLEIRDLAVSKVASLLQRRSILQELEIHMSPTQFAKGAETLPRAVGRYTPALDVLHIVTTELSIAEPLAFAKLSLGFADDDGESDFAGAAFDERDFPHIHSLELAGSAMFWEDMLEELRERHCPSLRHLSFETDRLYLQGYIPPDYLRLITTAFPKLCTLRIAADVPLSPIESQLVSDFGKSRGITTLSHPDYPQCPSAAFFCRTIPALDSGWNAEAQASVSASRSACPPLVRTLVNSLNLELECAERNHDEASFVGLAIALRTWELERLARIG
ncbi:hypothetical protein JCM11641_004448 [Rhodosporidiobolus odoratus]